MDALSDLAGRPDRFAPVIHIAGSKGKGSVTGMLASMLEAAGRRPARYMSPHIIDYRERISVGNSFFDESVYCDAGNELRDLVENKVPASKNSLFDPEKGGEPPTFFEILTMYYFLCARTGGCDSMVVETGLGGRLDSTNIVDPEVSIITLIELEHTAFLGDTIALIAGEKAGIIKPGRPLILARQSAEALEVFTKRTAEKRSPLFYYPDIASIENLKIHPGGTDFSLVINGKNMQREIPPIDLSIQIPGAVQAENAALAVIALKTAFPDISDDAIRRGLKQFTIPARFERIIEDPPLIIDGAHTVESVTLSAGTFCSLYGEEGILLFACAADKNAAGMADILLPRFSRVVITMPGTFRISESEKVYSAFCAQSGGDHSKIVFIKDTIEAIRYVLETARENKLPVLSIGSFYLAAEIRGFVLNTGSVKY